ncbi:MAG TPA: Ldh family oxidoreductase [Flavilitoribacter sp.]|nr:Ldh family oxidoreductase [Flavilitoribacter sp.]
MQSSPKYPSASLIRFAQALMEKAGLPPDRAEVVAETLVEADLMGHSTHGLELLPAYLKSLASGEMERSGDPLVLNDTGSTLTWDGRYLPGPWLVHQAIDQALDRIEQYPVVTAAIRCSHHIGCLAAYPERATKEGLLMLLSCSDPRNATVAPFGGVDGVYSPNPIAVGIPTGKEPIIIDISASTTANGLVARTQKEGGQLPHPWLMEKTGQLTTEPSAMFADPPATILPLGGLDAGYKGFALGLLVEALTSGLAGYGRADQPDKWGASVFLQLINPEAFGGKEGMMRQMDFLVNRSLESDSLPGGEPVRLPGSRALRLRDHQRKNGVQLYPTVEPALRRVGEHYGVDFPEGGE